MRRIVRADVAEVADVATLRAGHLPAVLRLTLMAMAVNGATAVIICGVRWAQVSLRSMLTWAMVIPSRAGLGWRGGSRGGLPSRRRCPARCLTGWAGEARFFVGGSAPAGSVLMALG